MRNLVLIVASFCVTIVGWGLYVPMLRWGQVDMSLTGVPARWRPFVCVGLAYFLIGVIVPVVLLKLRGERGAWTITGIIYSLLGGTLGALGALGIILAINFGGNPIYVAPLVFGSAPVVNSFLTIYLAGKMRDIGPLFLAGLVMVTLGAVTVLVFAPHKKGQPPAATVAAEAAPAPADATAAAPVRQPGNKASRFVLQLLSVAMVALCWGSYGPTLHKGQAAMMHSRLRPLLCVGLAYFAIAVLVPNLLLIGVVDEASRFTWSGTTWSLLAGAAGAVGALGIIMAFNFGGRPVYVMPLVFGGAPVVATLTSTVSDDLLGDLGPMFLAGLILVIAGSAMVLVFAPKGHAPAPVAAPAAPTPQSHPPAEVPAKDGAGI
ncbi:MAG: hypothetical protein DCC67_04170 [Planctomycetota bacterium]|nr:MAG: hypothetical protein DCC67_04170 [Planctomycetota bacterium]